MGRREAPLSDADSPCGLFAADLRALRISCGEPTYRRMASNTYFSAATLTRAASGRSLPSLEVTLAYVRACDGDPETWRQRWEKARVDQARHETRCENAEITGPTEQPDDEAPAPQPASATPSTVPAAGPPSAPTSRRRRQRRILLLGGAFALSLALNALLLLTASANPTPTTPVEDGTDPMANHCDDAVNLATAPVTLLRPATIDGHPYRAGATVGTITLRYSHRCAGAWGRFDPPRGLFLNPNQAGLTLQVSRPDDGSENTWRLGHIDETYTDLLLTGMGCVQAGATVTIFNGNATADGTTPCLPKIG